MLKKIIATLVMCTILFSIPCYAKEKTSKDQPGTAIFVMALPTSLTVKEHCLKEETTESKVNICYPTLQGFSNNAFEKKVNKYFKKRAKDLYKDTIKIASENNNAPYELLSQYHIKKSLPHYFTLGFFDYAYTGGAHGIPIQSYVTLDVAQNKWVVLKDLFDEQIDYQAEIKQAITKQIEDRVGHYAPFYDSLYDEFTIKDDQAFYIAESGDLVIVFNVYEIAPYATGVLEFKIPKTSLKGYRIAYSF